MSIKINKNGSIKEVTGGGGNFHVALIDNHTSTPTVYKGSGIQHIYVAKNDTGPAIYEMPFVPTIVVGEGMDDDLGASGAFSFAIVQGETISLSTGFVSTSTSGNMTLSGNSLVFDANKYPAASDFKPSILIFALG